MAANLATTFSPGAVTRRIPSNTRGRQWATHFWHQPYTTHWEMTHEDYTSIISRILAQLLAPMSSPVFKFQCSNDAAEHNWAPRKIQPQPGSYFASTIRHSPGFWIRVSRSNHPRPITKLPSPVASGAPNPHIWSTVHPYILAWNPTRYRSEVGPALLGESPVGERTNRVSPSTSYCREGSRMVANSPCPRNLISTLPGLAMAPLGLRISQATINAQGEIVPRHRLTHDQLFELQVGASVNSRVQFHKRTPSQCGTAHFMHNIVSLRRQHPTTRILLTELDFKAAYRRLHVAPAAAIQSVVTLDSLEFLALRLTFGEGGLP